MAETPNPCSAFTEIHSMHEESQRLWSQLNDEEKEVKRREHSQHVVVILLREIERLKSDAYDDSAKQI